MDSDKKSKYSEFPIYPSTPPKIKYELTTLPLQKEIGEVRKIVSRYYLIAKGQYNIAASQVSESYKTVQDQAAKHGITIDSTAVQAGSVGGAVLLGYLLARRKSYFRKIVYPLMGGALVGGAFYISVPENQTDAYRRIQELIRRVWPK